MKIVHRSHMPATRDVFGGLFEDFFGTEDFPALAKVGPAVDIVEDKDKYTLKADLPGMKQEEVKVEVEDGVLRISGERKFERKEGDEKHYTYYERSYGAFERRFTLPKDTDSERIDAKYENGVLEVSIPKTEAKKPKEIKVK